MEILIVGAILVAIMVVVSTKIKKSAASAYNRETIETEEFALTKPEGFLHPLNENSKYAFEAHSKEMGKGEAEEFYRAQANLQVFPNANSEAALDKIKLSGVKILSEKVLENAPENQKIYFVETEEDSRKTKIFSFWKIVENIRNGKVYELQIQVLEDFCDEYRERANEMLESFVVR